MEPDAGSGEASVESEFATTVKYLDLYLRQKTDLFLQHYLFEPFTALGNKVMYLAVIVTLLAAGTLVLLGGIIFLMATVIPLWAALLIAGIVIVLLAGVIAHALFNQPVVLQTPTALEMVNREKE